MSYQISSEIKTIANRLGLIVKPSRAGNKKIEVIHNDRKYQLGDKRYPDFWVHRKESGNWYAYDRKRAYYARHKNTIEQNKIRSVLSWILLWDGLNFFSSKI